MHENSGGQRNGRQVLMIISESHDGVPAESGEPFKPSRSSTSIASTVQRARRRIRTTSGISSTRGPAITPACSRTTSPIPTVRGARHQGVWWRRSYLRCGCGRQHDQRDHGRWHHAGDAYIPNETKVPFRDATPTCIAETPNGMLYVATLNFVANLFVCGSGLSNVW